MSQLCDLPLDTAADCCTPSSPPPAAPIRPSNVPRLAQIAYRIGTFSSFRRAMLGALTQLLPAWRPAAWGQDYAITFLELWAYIADVLTFYQERIANEAYLGTATQRDSLVRLAQLVDYRVGPGAAANALLAFMLEKNKTATVRTGLRVSSKPSAGRPAAIFETDAAVQATAAHNSIGITRMARANQFATLDANVLAVLAGKTPADRPSAIAALFPKYANLLNPTGGVEGGRATMIGGGGGVPAALTQPRTVVFKGLNLKLRPGDWLLVAAATNVVRQINTTTVDPVAKTTSVTWMEEPEYVYASSWVEDPPVYAFRARANPFGHDVPDQTSLAQALINMGQQLQIQLDNEAQAQAPWQQLKQQQVLVQRNEPMTLMLAGPAGGGTTHHGGGAASGSSGSAATGIADPTLPEDPSRKNVLDLDRVYNGVVPSAPGSHSMIVLMSPNVVLTTEVAGVQEVTHIDYGLRARVTELTLAKNISTDGDPPPVMSARETTVLLQSEALTLADDRPLPDPMDGSVLLLDGLFGDLQPGQRVIVQGTDYDTQAPTAEDAMVESVTVDAATNTTSVLLHQALGNRYRREGAKLLANVAPASQGETVKDEVLGSGDGAAWQTHTLRKSPLTYVQAPAQASEAAVVSTLQVIVGGVMWSERPNLLDAGPADRVYFTQEDAAGKTSVTFGDGTSGARPPTGKDNIHASYRKGLGQAGNVDTGAIAQMVDSVPGIQSVTNPEPAAGGADRESEDQIRANAPTHLRTFNRAVAIDDFANLALAFPGVAMASAAWHRLAPAGGTSGAVRTLPQPVIRLTIGTANGKRLDVQADFSARLRRYLDARRDVNVPLTLRDFDPVYVDFAATIDVDDAYGRQATLRAAIAAMNFRANPDGSPAFFASLKFGEAVNLSAVYAALQSVPGVRAATVTTLRQVPVDTDPSLVRSSIPVGPTGRGLIGNEADDVSDLHGRFGINLGTGGFAD